MDPYGYCRQSASLKKGRSSVSGGHVPGPGQALTFCLTISSDSKQQLCAASAAVVPVSGSLQSVCVAVLGLLCTRLLSSLYLGHWFKLYFQVLQCCFGTVLSMDSSGVTVELGSY